MTEDYYICTFECDYDIRSNEGLLILNLDDLYALSEIEETGETLEEIEFNNKIN